MEWKYWEIAFLFSFFNGTLLGRMTKLLKCEYSSEYICTYGVLHIYINCFCYIISYF